MTLKGHSNNIMFLSVSIFRLVQDKKLTKLTFWVQSVHFWSCDITKHGIYNIFKDRDFWFGLKNSIKSCAEHFTTVGVIKYISGQVTGYELFFDRKVPI